MNPTAPLSLRMQLAGLLLWLAATLGTGAIGAIASVEAASFYGQLIQPSWAPPARLFGPVWTVLYLLMGVSAWLVWRKHGFSNAATALGVFAAQLLVNGVWSWLFFAWRLGFAALMDIAVLWVLIVATVVLFWRLHRVAASLLMPYLAWVSFASALNFNLWHNNPALLH